MALFPKPRVPIINGNHPLSKGLAFDAPLSEGGGSIIYDILTKIACGAATITWEGHQYGKDVTGTYPFVWPTGFTDPCGGNIFTVFALIYPTSASFGAVIGNGNNAAVEFRMDAGLTLSLLRQATANIGTSSGVVILNQWNTVAVSYHGTTGALNFYINGLPAGSSTNITTVGTGRICIGAQGGSGEAFTGKIALVRVYNKALGANAIKMLSANPWQIYGYQKQ